MITTNEYIKQSLGLHLYFARLIKEHAFFLQIGVAPKNYFIVKQADYLSRVFSGVLSSAINLSNGVVENDVLQSGEIITPFTLESEKLSIFYTGIGIQTNLTEAEANLTSGGPMVNPSLAADVNKLNDNALNLLASETNFLTELLANVVTCKVLTSNYPALIAHTLNEAQMYMSEIRALQSQEDINFPKWQYEQESFWNHIMGEHAEFLRGYFDTTEKELIMTANIFALEYDKLFEEFKLDAEKALPPEQLTNESLTVTGQIQVFKTQCTQALLGCNIRSTILPLFSDHLLRETNHYLRLLNMFDKGEPALYQ